MMTLNRTAFRKIIQEDLDWLLNQPRSLERDHIEHLLRHADRTYYGPENERPIFPQFTGIIGIDWAVGPDKQVTAKWIVHSNPYDNHYQGQPCGICDIVNTLPASTEVKP
jgi:hypothetical protein